MTLECADLAALFPRRPVAAPAADSTLAGSLIESAAGSAHSKRDLNG